MSSAQARAIPLSLCVYCGAKVGNRPRYAIAAAEVGRLIASKGWNLVYGGGRVGLMGQVADAALAQGGQALGIIPSSLVSEEVAHPGLSELRVVPNMHTRKKEMMDAADAFLALPGGIGTLEEVFEVWTWLQLGLHSKPVGLLNVSGYFDPLLACIDSMVKEGFLEPSHQQLLLVDSDPDRLLQSIGSKIAAAQA